MAITAATLMVKVGADTKAAEQQLSSFGNALKGMLSGMAMGAGMAAFNMVANAAQGAVAGMGAATQAASNLGETVNKVSVVMGSSAQDILDWSRNSAGALGMSRDSALSAAASFGVFGKSAGLTGAALTKFSTDFVGLAADMASFSNTTPEDAIQAIGAALRGEAEPIRRYGILLDDASLRQAALAQGIIATTKNALTPQQRVLAAQAEIWRQTADAQGDFGRTSEGLANQQRILDANMANLSATLGTAFLPVMTQATLATNRFVSTSLPYLSSVMDTVLVPAINSGITAFTDWIGAQLGFATGMDGSAESVKAFTEAFVTGVNNEIDAMNAALEATEIWANQGIEAYDMLRFGIANLAYDFTVSINEIITALNQVSIKGNDFFNSFGAGMAAMTGNTFTPTIAAQQIPLVPVGAPPKQEWSDLVDLPRIGQVKIDWDAAVKVPAKTAADAAGQAIAGAVSDFGASAKSAIDDLANKLKGVPGLFGVSPVTDSDMAKAAAGMSVNKADTWRARAEDELRNGVDWAEIDPTAIAKSLGLDPSVPLGIIADELNRQWASGEFFADPQNLVKIDWAAVKMEVERSAKAELGQANLLASAIQQGITPESMDAVAQQIAEVTKTGIPKWFEEVQAGVSIAAGIATSLGTPDAIAAIQGAAVSTYAEYMAKLRLEAESNYFPPPSGSPPPNGGPPPTPPGLPPTGLPGAPPGVPGNAAGNAFFPGGYTWVGERGPELVRLPGGSRIYNATQSAALNDGPGIVINATINRDIDIEKLAWKLEQVRARRSR